MTKIDIYSGFLGAGKTTLIKKLIKEAYPGEKLMLIENEFGKVSIDGGFLKDAVVGHTTGEITYDDVIKLYFSLDKRYRRRAVWIMNDETALKLRTLKDSAGNYLWNQQDNTILGKRVHISNYMPGEAAGAKPIAFGDFRYFWIIDRWPFEMCRLTELFALQQQVGFIGHEYLDAKLIRPEAIHVMQITA